MKIKDKNSSFFHWVGVVAVGVVLGVGMQFAQAWTNPPETIDAPEGNVAGPITTGPNNQTKLGGSITAKFLGAVKMYSQSTVDADIGTTLVTKDYIHNKTQILYSSGSVRCTSDNALTCSKSGSGVKSQDVGGGTGHRGQTQYYITAPACPAGLQATGCFIDLTYPNARDGHELQINGYADNIGWRRPNWAISYFDMNDGGKCKVRILSPYSSTYRAAVQCSR